MARRENSSKVKGCFNVGSGALTDNFGNLLNNNDIT